MKLNKQMNKHTNKCKSDWHSNRVAYRGLLQSRTCLPMKVDCWKVFQDLILHRGNDLSNQVMFLWALVLVMCFLGIPTGKSCEVFWRRTYDAFVPCFVTVNIWRAIFTSVECLKESCLTGFSFQRLRMGARLVLNMNFWKGTDILWGKY